MNAYAKSFDLVPRDVQTALTEFRQDLMLSLTAAPLSGLAELGLKATSQFLKTTYPFDVSAEGLVELSGDVRYRDLAESEISLTPRIFHDAAKILASKIESLDWVGWGEQPRKMALNIKNHPEKLIAAVLEAGGSTACWDGVNFFSATHPVNMFESVYGTFSNTTGSRALTLPNLKLAKEEMLKKKAPNGEPMGLVVTHILVPPALAEEAKDLLENDMIIDSLDGSNFGAITNRHKGTCKLVVSHKLTDDNDWYALALGNPGMIPWVYQDRGAPEVIQRDKSSDLYATTFEVATIVKVEAEAGLMMPHCIHRYQG